MAERFIIPNYIILNGHRYNGFSNFFSTETWTFVNEPTRANDGVIYNLNEYDRFPTFRIWITFTAMKPAEFQQLLKDIELPEFTVKAYNLKDNNWKLSRMYMQKEEQHKLFTKITNYVKQQRIGEPVSVNQFNKLKPYYDNGAEIVHIDPFSIQLVSTNAPMGSYRQTVTFYPNGGTGVVHPIGGYTGELITLYNGVGFTAPAGTALLKWNTLPDGTGLSYNLSEPHYIGTEDLKLYAIWKSNNLFTLNLNYSGIDAGTNPITINVTQGNTFSGLPTSLTRKHYNFNGWFDYYYNFIEDNINQWNTWLNEGKIKRYENNSTVFTNNFNTTIFAMWRPVEYKLTFETNGGTPIASITQGYGTYIKPFFDPTKEGFVFDGFWSKNGQIDPKQDWGSKLTISTMGESITAYAKWIAQ